MYFTLSVELVTWHGAWSWQIMWWSQVAWGLELIWFGFKCSQVVSSDMILKLIWLHVTSPKLHLWPILFFCNAKDYQMVKTILSSIKIVPLVQSGFENKKGPHFIVAKIGQTNFVKSRIFARINNHEFMCFCPLWFLPIFIPNTSSILF